jgi:hypothetical protein
MEVLLAFVSWILGTIATIVITVRLEHLRSSNLQLSIPQTLYDFQPRGPLTQRWRSLRVFVRNEALPTWANWLTRLPAQQCRAQLTFLRADGTPLYPAIVGKWTDTPEPKVVLVATPDGQTVPLLTNPQELRLAVDLYPGDGALLDVAIRVDGEDASYVWNNDTYKYEDWRNTDLKLDKAIFLVKVTVTSSGRTCTEYFRLANDASFIAFLLSEPSATERQAIKKAGS